MLDKKNVLNNYFEIFKKFETKCQIVFWCRNYSLIIFIFLFQKKKSNLIKIKYFKFEFIFLKKIIFLI